MSIRSGYEGVAAAYVRRERDGPFVHLERAQVWMVKQLNLRLARCQRQRTAGCIDVRGDG